MDFSHLLINLIEPLALSSSAATSTAPKSAPEPNLDPSEASLDLPQASQARRPTSPLKIPGPPVVSRSLSPLPSHLAVPEKPNSRSTSPDPATPPRMRSRPPRSPGPRAMKISPASGSARSNDIDRSALAERQDLAS